MTTTNTKLLVQLRELHEQLSGMNTDPQTAKKVDEQTIEALGQLVTDASDLIDKTKSAPESESIEEEHGDLMDRVIQFEREHPRVTSFLNQMTDLLTMMGI